MDKLFELSAELTLDMDAFTQGLQKAEQSAKELQRLLLSHMSAATSGLPALQSTAGSVWSAITSSIQSAINKTREFLSIQGSQRISLSTGSVSSGDSSLLSSTAPTGSTSTISYKSFATGLPYVPYDHFEASLHQGEAVLTRLEASQWRAGTASAAPAVDPQALAQAMAEALQGVAVVMDGQAVGELVAPTVSAAMGRESRARRYTG